MIHLPSIIKSMVGKYVSESIVVTRVISIDEKDNVQVEVVDNATHNKYKIVMPIDKVLNVLGYNKKEDKKVTSKGEENGL